MKKLILIGCFSAMSLFATEMPEKYKACIGCHGDKGQKVALGKSKVIKEMTKEEIVIALKGYKDGTYGGAMKGVMKGQSMSLTDEDMTKIAEYISSL